MHRAARSLARHGMAQRAHKSIADAASSCTPTVALLREFSSEDRIAPSPGGTIVDRAGGLLEPQKAHLQYRAFQETISRLDGALAELVTQVNTSAADADAMKQASEPHYAAHLRALMAEISADERRGAAAQLSPAALRRLSDTERITMVRARENVHDLRTFLTASAKEMKELIAAGTPAMRAADQLAELNQRLARKAHLAHASAHALAAAVADRSVIEAAARAEGESSPAAEALRSGAPLEDVVAKLPADVRARALASRPPGAAARLQELDIASPNSLAVPGTAEKIVEICAAIHAELRSAGVTLAERAALSAHASDAGSADKGAAPAYLSAARALPPPPQPAVARVNADPAAARTLLQWVRAHRGYVSPSVTVGPAPAASAGASPYDGNWGLTAVRDIAAGEIVATVPLGLCLFPLNHPLAPESVSPLPQPGATVTAMTASRDGAVTAPATVVTGSADELAVMRTFFALDAGAYTPAGAATLPEVKPPAAPGTTAASAAAAELAADILAGNPTAVGSAGDPSVPHLRWHTRDQSDAFYQGLATVAAGAPREFPALRLALRLLAERAANRSVFAPYLNCLPAAFPSHPLFFTQDAMQTMGYQPLANATVRRARALHALSSAVNTPEPAPAQLTPLQRAGAVAFNGFDVSAADLAWAVAAVTSRALRLPALPVAQYTRGSASDAPSRRQDVPLREAAPGDLLCLAPVVDMCNHSSEPSACVTFLRVDPAAPGLGGYHVAVRALRPLATGDELTVNYFRPNKPEDLVATLNSMLTQAPVARNAVVPLAWGAAAAAAAVAAPAAAEAAGAGAGALSAEPCEQVFSDYGFVPAWSARDRFELTLNRDLLRTAMTMALDLGTDPLKPDAVRTTALHRLQLAAPAPSELLTLQEEIIDAALALAGPEALFLSWGGPSPVLTALCRALAAGTCAVPPPRDGSPLIDETLSFERTRIEEEATAAAAAAAARTVARGEDVARRLWATHGRVIANEEMSAADRLFGLSHEPLSEANEMGARAILYNVLVLHTAMFRTKLSNDAEEMKRAAAAGDAATYTALQVARGKKQLLTHALMMLAKDLEVDEKVHAWHRALL